MNLSSNLYAKGIPITLVESDLDSPSTTRHFSYYGLSFLLLLILFRLLLLQGSRGVVGEGSIGDVPEMDTHIAIHFEVIYTTLVVSLL